MINLYCKKVDEVLFDLRYLPLEYLVAQHELGEVSQEAAIAEIIRLGYFEVQFPDMPDDGFAYRPSPPDLVNGILVGKWIRLNEDQTLERYKQIAILAKQQRQQLLQQCDWTQLADVPLTADKKQEWETYRQALRDISTQDKFPWRITWPVAPK